MNTPKITLLIWMFLFSSFSLVEIEAQSTINIGLRSEIGINQISIGEITENDFNILPVQNLSLTIDVDIYKNISVLFSPGFIFSKNYYEGFELGGYLGYRVLDSTIYSYLGINYHFNSSVDGNSGGSGETISLIGLGVGYKISKKISMEVSYHHPLEKFYGSFGYPGFHQNYNIKRIIEIGFGLEIN